MKKYTSYIYKTMSDRLEITPKEVDEMSKEDVFDNLVAWNLGYSQWSDTIRQWVEDVYQIELK